MSLVAFDRVDDAGLDVLVRTSLRDRLLPILIDAREAFQRFDAQPLHGGRGATFLVDDEGERFVVRGGRRGGLPGRFLEDLYFGRTPRVFDELAITEELRRRGAPVVEVLAAAAQWLAPFCYRSWLVTRWVPRARTLFEWARDERGDGARAAGFRAAGRAVRQVHEAGARHPDLNMNNLLVYDAGGATLVAVIDFDGARLAAGAADATRALSRLRRSAHKLDPRRAVVAERDLAAFEAGYREG